MPEGAPGGPGQEEAGAEAPEQEVAEEPVRLNEVPAPTPAEEPSRRRWWPFGRREERAPQPQTPPAELEREQARMEEERRQAERQAGEPMGGRERIEQLARSRTPEDLVHLLSIISAEQFRELKLNERHGTGRIAALRKILAGERDFDLTPDGQTRHRAWRELGRKALVTVFNRKTALAAGTLGVIGILTGGVGLPAAGAMIGAMAGRGVAEAWESIRGEERGLREEIAQAHYDQWCQLRELACRAQDESLSEQDRSEALRNIIEGFHNTSQPVREREQELQEVQARWDKRRGMASSIGAVAGLGAGFWAGFQGLSEMATRLDLDGNGIFHHVERINGVWHFAYNNAAEIQTAQNFGAQVLPGGFHIVGPDAARIPAEILKNLLPEAGRVAGVFAGLALGGLWARRAERGRAEDEEREQARRERRERETRERLLGQVPAVEASPTPAEAQAEVPAQERFQEMARELGKGLPELGQIWLTSEIHPETGKKYQVAYRIRNIDWANGTLIVDQLDSGNYNDVLATNVTMGIEDLLRQGREMVEDWLLTVQDGDEIEIAADVIVDRSDPKAPKIAAGKYKFKRLEKKPGQAELAQEGKRKPIVDIFDLAIAGVRPVAEKKEGREGGDTPRAEEIWSLKEGLDPNQLPANLRAIERLGIREIRGGRAHCFRVNDQGRREGPIIKVDIAVIKNNFDYDEPLPRGGGGGQQGQRQRRNP